MSAYFQIRLFIIGFFALCITSCDTTTSEGNVTTLFLVRHTEKAENTGHDDPELTERGRERAGEIAVMLEKAKIDALYATPYQRTVGTLKPLATKSSLEVNEYDEELDLKDLMNGILEKHSGERVVIAGHSTTIPGMLNVLTSGNDYTAIEEGRHDDLFQVIITSKSQVEVIHLKNSTKQ